MKNQFLVLFAVICCFTAVAQNVVLDTLNVSYRNNLTSYYELQTAKTKLEIEKIDEKKVKKEFLKNYTEKKSAFEALIKKGIFIEHDNYTALLNSILQKLKNANIDNNIGDIKILLAISDEANAYNCGDEIVVIQLPLMLKVDNEYDLAYIISHEIAHQKLNHVYNSMLKSSEQNNSEVLKKQTKEIDVLKYNKHKVATTLFKNILYNNRLESRKREKEADSLGYIFFKKAYPDYHHRAVVTLKNLKNIDVEQDSLSKQDFIKLFAVQNLKFKDEWIASDIVNYNYQKTEKFWNIDSLRTHPDCDERISFLKKSFKIDDKLIPITNAVLNNYRINAQKEYVFGLFFIEEYGESLYKTLLQLKQNPSDVFYKKMMHDNLLKLQKARNNYTLNKYLETESPNYATSYNQFLCIIRNLRKNELNQLIEFYKS